MKPRRAKPSVNNPANKPTSTDVVTEFESSPITRVSTIRLSRLTSLRRSLIGSFMSSLRNRQLPSVNPSIEANSSPLASSEASASPRSLAALPELGKSASSSMDTSEQTQPVSASAPPPVAFSRLKAIANGACEAALSSASAYDHSSTESWNTTIINTILQSLVQETSTPTSQPQYKFAINSTIIEHAPQSATATSGKRGMHSAAAAYWNAEKDGMWNFKYEAAEPKGLDVVIGIIWISI